MSQELKNIATSINEISTEQHNLGTLLHKLMKQVEELMGEPFNLS